MTSERLILSFWAGSNTMQQASKGAQAGFTFSRGVREQPSLHDSLDNVVPLTQKPAFLLEAILKPGY